MEVTEQPMVSVYKTHYEKEHGWFATIDEILEQIKNPIDKSYIDVIYKLRNLPDAEEEKKLKQKLPLICFSGTFSKRTDKDCIKHSGFICLDFDDESFDTIMKKKEYIYAAFKSPTGTGVKVLVRIPAIVQDHSDYYMSLSIHFGLATIDEKCKNISRGCYMSYDPGIYINTEAPIFYNLIPKFESKREKSQINNAYYVDNEDKTVQRLLLQHQNEFVSGNRNQACYILACEFNRFGIKIHRAIQEMEQFAESDFTISEIERTARSAYEANREEHNKKVFKDRTNVSKAQNMLKQNMSEEDVLEELMSNDNIPPEKAKSILDEAVKLNQQDEFWETTKNNNIEINTDKFYQWFEDNQLFRFIVNEKGDWTMIHDDNGEIEEINMAGIKEILLEYIKEKEKDSSKRSKIIKKLTREYLIPTMIEWIPPSKIDFVRDDRDAAYFFYKNQWIKITKDGINTVLKNHEKPGKIWKNKRHNREVHIIDGIDNIKHGEFFIFIWNIITGHRHDDSNQDVVADFEKFNAICRTIGYILHGFKDRSNPRAVILTDEVISDNPEGGVGKGVFLKGISYMRNMLTVDGKNFNSAKTFLWQRVTLATEIIAMEDVVRNFDFEKQFSTITEGITVEQKFAKEIHIPYEDSPKLMITSNYVIQGTGASHERRRIEIELKQFFKPDYSPRDQFGHNLYDDWSKEEWNLFDNFMFYCVQQYLLHGVAKPVNKNLSFKKLKNNVPDMFIEWMQMKEFLPDEYYELGSFADHYRKIDKDSEKETNRKISKWIKEYCIYRKWEYLTKTTNSGTHFTIRQ